MLQWISTCSDYLYKDLVRALLKSDDVPEEDLAVARRDLEVVDRQLQDGSFLLGNEIYLCDLFLAPMIAFAENHKSKPQLFRGLDGLAAWQKRLWSRDSFQETQS